jgi:NADH:ubiquinone oxidoreductase subunit 2 (subunit N)
MINSISNAFSNNILYDVNSFSEIYSHFTYIQLPLAIMSVGFLFKIGSAPFHF